MTIEPAMEKFLERMVRESGIDRSNLIRMFVWEKMQQERDRQLAEKQFGVDKKPRS